MSKNLISVYLSPIFLLALTCTTALASTDANRIVPGTPQAAQAMAELRHAEKVDRMNSRSYSGGEDSDAGVYYHRKAQEAKALLDELRSNQSITTGDLRHVLDTSGAARLTGGD